MTVLDLSNVGRLALRDLAEAFGARVEGYYGGCLCLSMQPHDDRRGWSGLSLDLCHALERLGCERVANGWREPATVPRDPYAGRDGYLFLARFRPTREPFPLSARCEGRAA